MAMGLVMAGCSGDGSDEPDDPTTHSPPESTFEAETSTSRSVSTTAPEDFAGVAVAKDVAYSTEFTLDVYYPEEGGEWPVAVVFHGGEVLKESMADYASQVAEGGVVVFVPEFSSTPAALSDVLHRGAEDAVCAMRYARARASDFGGNGNRVVAAGLSYGAVVGALMTLAGDQFEGDCLVESDVTAMGDGFVGLDGLYDFAELPEALGFHDLYSMDQMQTASATNYVMQPAREDVDFVLFTGSDAFAQDQAELFRARLDDAGYPVDILARPDVPHSVMFPTQAEGAVEALIKMAFGYR